MAALSDYLESGILNHIFRGSEFVKPTNISIALTSGVPKDFDTGETIPELPTIVDNLPTNYTRISLGSPSDDGDSTWNDVGVDENTAYQIYNPSQVNHSGYFYPLFLTQDAAENKDLALGGLGVYEEFQFDSFSSEVFYGPVTLFSSGVENQSNAFSLYEGNGFIKNNNQIIFGTALAEWGWVSGIAILDDENHGQGNLLMYAQLSNPRYVYLGDNIRFDPNSLEISLN
jgi:hypothetical protein